jgi:uncharacterized protein YbbK (DUF523 family)
VKLWVPTAEDVLRIIVKDFGPDCGAEHVVDFDFAGKQIAEQLKEVVRKAFLE